MSVYSNPADATGEQARAYVSAVLALVEGMDPMAVLRETPGAVAATLTSVPRAGWRIPEAPGKWSLAGVVQHLADSELVWGWRLRRVLAEDRPTIEGFDQDRWAVRLGYDEADAAAALRVFRTLREANLTLLAAAAPGGLERVGIHAERGEETVAHMVRLYAGHDLVHRNQLERIRAVVAPPA